MILQSCLKKRKKKKTKKLIIKICTCLDERIKDHSITRRDERSHGSDSHWVTTHAHTLIHINIGHWFHAFHSWRWVTANWLLLVPQDPHSEPPYCVQAQDPQAIFPAFPFSTQTCQKCKNPVSLFANPRPFQNGSPEGQNKDSELSNSFCLLYCNVGTITNATNVMGIYKNNIAMVQLFLQREGCIGVGPFLGYLLARRCAYVIFWTLCALCTAFPTCAFHHLHF